MSRPQLSLVLPCRNEAAALPPLLKELMAWAKQGPWARGGVECLLVDDASQDGSGALAKRLGARVLRTKGLGYGGALCAGFAAARGLWLGMLDADGSYPAPNFSRLWPLRGQAVLAMLDRFGDPSGMPALRRLGNRALSRWAALKLGRAVPDLNSGQRLFHRQGLAWTRGLPQGLDFSPAFTLAWARQGSLAWAQGSYRERVGDSKLSLWMDGLRFARQIAKY